jgi:hypothetical protein
LRLDCCGTNTENMRQLRNWGSGPLLGHAFSVANR